MHMHDIVHSNKKAIILFQARDDCSLRGGEGERRKREGEGERRERIEKRCSE